MTARTTSGGTTPRPLGPAGTGFDAWPLDPGILHLNHGSYGAVPRIALAAQQGLRDEMEADPVGWFITLPARMAAARAELAPFLGLEAEGFAFVPNASAGASAVFGSLPHEPGGEIVVTDHGYGAVTMGAERLARHWGGKVVTAAVPLDADEHEAAERIISTFSPRTRLVLIDQITSPTARRLPVERVACAAAERGIRVLVDGAHAPGLIGRPVPEAKVTWVGNLHKFACAPRGTAVVVPTSDLRDDLHPVIDSWGASLGFPERFDHQGTVDGTAPLAAVRAVDFISETWGWPAVRAHAGAMAAYAVQRIADAFAAVTGEDHHVPVGMPVDQIRLVRLPGPLATTPASAHHVRDRLKAEHRSATAPTSFGGRGYLRVAPHAYTSTSHVDQFVDRVVPSLLDWARSGGA
ncbi:aminotransferase class V-fold PLP-dependent enzyme [Ornithinimicrobium pratense]|uniref:Aminotransferase class V-fold PLP-dependent enzyme n=1 Tax=Ornithinimicrobium pratense TaxID=2593973 RepID=A0A5J6VAJ8_9MICO|nr:aminotransferase class V-fold PLP-dependent enzyme [Ornithinimicrobium pratense]